MENGKWKMENGTWKMENEKWKIANSKWKICEVPPNAFPTFMFIFSSPFLQLKLYSLQFLRFYIVPDRPEDSFKV